MSTTDRPPSDAAVRDLVTGRLDTTFLVDAGAGTGKTRILVDRYVRCVLDPELGTGDVRSVAAITFTEKAAGELRQRVREELERRETAAAAGSREAAVLAAALEALDDAPISTIHGFAGRLLREVPVAAGVDPAFEQLDALASELNRARLWSEWLAQLAADDEAPAREWVSRLLRAGVALDTIRRLALMPGGVFDERYDLEPVTEAPPEPDLPALCDALRAPTAALRDYCAGACLFPADKGCTAALDLVESCERLLNEPPDDTDLFAGRLHRLAPKSGKTAPGGAKGNWDEVRGGKDELRRLYLELAEAVESVQDAHAASLTGLAVAAADVFARWAGAEQLRQGRLDFTDLLGLLRDLLLRDLDARAALQQRFRYLLVDEFQDTDPLQAEIVVFLSEREPRADDWRSAELTPGKLFVVGDPKQSIYRFRRADISLYDLMARLITDQPAATGRVLSITQNFRTTPALVEWVNAVCPSLFDDAREGRQPRYQAVEPFRPAAPGPAVSLLLGRTYEGESFEARRDEASALAALLTQVCAVGADEWQVHDRGAGRDQHGAEAFRAASWRDVALLVRTTTDLDTYEQAFRDAGIPYRVEGGTTYFRRREVADLLLCLRAVDDPADGPAVYGALHSSLFGFSDDELFLFHEAGGRFDPFAHGQPDDWSAVTTALGLLRALHGRRAEREPHELVEELVRLAHVRETLAATGPGGEQAIVNVERLIERAEAFAGAGGGGLGPFLSWAAEAAEGAGEQESPVDDEGDVVRLLTIHKAKGLEFPIVVLVGGALGGGGGRPDGLQPVADREQRRLRIKLKAALPGGSPCELQPGDWRRLHERENEMGASELRRLLYVAVTRARDHLVLSCFGKLLTAAGEPARGVLLAPLAARLPLAGATGGGGDELLRVLRPWQPAPPSPLPPPALADLLAGRDAWLGARRRLLRRAGQTAPATSPSGLEHVDEEVRTGGPGAPPGRARALALGSAVHRTLELCDLGDDASLADAAATAARELDRADLADEAAALAAACWRTPPVRAAARSDQVYRELTVGVLLDDVIVSGAIDLLYRDGDDWVVVDYKTDRGADAELLRERYSPQGGAYALAVEAATGGVVREVVFIAAAAGGLVVTVPVDDTLRELARREAQEAARAGESLTAADLLA